MQLFELPRLRNVSRENYTPLFCEYIVLFQKNLLPPTSSFSSSVLKMEVSCSSEKLVLKCTERRRKRTQTSQALLRGSCILKISLSFPATRFGLFKVFNINELGLITC